MTIYGLVGSSSVKFNIRLSLVSIVIALETRPSEELVMNCNQILVHVADENYMAFIDSLQKADMCLQNQQCVKVDTL